MSKRLIHALMVATVCFSSAAYAKLEAPNHVIYGNATVFGQAAPNGALIELKIADGETLATYKLGSEKRLGQQFALYIPMDTIDPRPTGYARTGDAVEIYLNKQLAAKTDVGEEGVAVRLDIDPQTMGTGPGISIDPAEITEGNSGTTTATFRLLMNTTADQPVNITWRTEASNPVSATSGSSCVAGIDYIESTGTATIPAGSLSGKIDVPICGDTEIEPNETFQVLLTGVANNFGVLQSNSAVGTILDDDNLPVASINDARATEPKTGTSPMVFSVTLSRTSINQVSFDYVTSGGTATVDVDYTMTSGTLVIPAGQSSGSIAVPIKADSEVEPEETFQLLLSNPKGVTLSKNTVTGLIVDPENNQAVVPREDVTATNSTEDLIQPGSIQISPDGKHAYATSATKDAVMVFARDDKGALTHQRSYTTANAGTSLNGADALLISPDGKHVYVAAQKDNALVVFSRNEQTGELTLVERLSDGANGVTGLQGVTAMGMSADGAQLYVAGSTLSTLTAFTRDPATGKLTFVETETNETDDPNDAGGKVTNMDRPSGVSVSPDGKQVFVTSSFGNSLAVFDRKAADSGKVSFKLSHRDGLLGIDGLSGASSVLVSPDGKQLYVTGEAEDALVVFDRNPDNGSITLRTVLKKGAGNIVGMDGPKAMTLSPDGKELYVVGVNDHSLTVFTRDPADGSLTVRETVFDNEGNIKNMAGPRAVATSPDGQNVYVAASVDNAIVVFYRTAHDVMFNDGFE